MTNKKGKIEIDFDEKGKVKKLTFGEDIATSKIMELINNISNSQNFKLNHTTNENTLQNLRSTDLEDLSIMDKLTVLVKQFKYGWFTSKDVQLEYQNRYGEQVKLSTISTYLSRMFEDGILDRRGSRKRREFQLITEKIIQTPLIEEK